MQRSDLKRPRFFMPIGFALILAGISAVIFHPDFQKKMLLEHVGPLVDSLEVDYIHFTPWSLKLNKVAVDYEGGHFQVGEGKIEFCLSSLLLLKLNLKTLFLDDVIVDVTEFNPPAKPPEIPEKVTGPFPGVLASLQYGLGYVLQKLNINATVSLPNEQSVIARITGGGIRPNSGGAINIDIRFNTGTEQDHIDLVGEIRLDQLTRGRFAAIQSTLDVQAALASLPDVERVNANLIITTNQASEPPLHHSESIHLSLLQKDKDKNNRSTLTLDGIYSGNNGIFSNGTYKITANERLVQPYAGEKLLPVTEEVLSGELDFDITNLTGNMTIISELLLTELKKAQANEQLPELLRIKNNFRVSLLPEKQLRIEKLDTDMSDTVENQPLVTSLPADLNIPLDDIDGFMRQENTLLEFTLPKVPLKWLDKFLPEQDITGGQLTAAFRIITDTNSAIHLKPMKPLEITGLTIKQAGEPLIDDFNLSVLTAVTYSGDSLAISLNELVAKAGKRILATGNLKAALPLSDEQKGAINVQAGIELNTKSLLNLLAIKQTGRQTLPEHFTLNFQTTVKQQPDRIVISKLDAKLTKDKKTRLLNLQLQQPLIMETSEAGTKFRNTSGTLATLNISDIQLGWFSSFLPDTTLKGKLHSTNFSLTTDTKGVAAIRAVRPFRVKHVTITNKDGPVLEDLGISVLPSIRLAPEGTGITYKKLAVTSESTSLLTGNGKIMLPAKAGKPLLASGKLNANLEALSKQPIIAEILKAEISSPLRFEADYKLAQGKTRIDISRLTANLFYSDAAPKITLQADSKVRLYTKFRSKQSEIGRAKGKVTLTVADLTPKPFAKVLAANGLTFKQVNGQAELSSNGKALTVKTIEPFVINGIEVKTEDASLLQSFTLTAGTEMTLQGNALHTKLAPFTIDFDKNKKVHTVDGTVDLTMKSRGDNSWVDTLNADLTILLPSLLSQPAIMPEHTLTAGKLTSVTTINSSGQVDSTTRILGLKSKQELPLELLEIRVGGKLDTDGSFDLKAPVKTVGKTGESDLLIKAVHSTKQVPSNDINIAIDSTVLYLNDILNTLKAVSGETTTENSEAEEEKTAENETDPALELQPDERAFWDALPYNFHTDTHIKRLFYTDYLEIYDIKGHTDFTSGRLSLDKYEAHFRDNPITLDGAITFTPGETPYDLKLQAGAEKFDLATFSRELDPEAIPRAEGLFDVKIDAFGKSPNMAQYRNQLFFDMRMQSRDGIFRLLNPNSAVIQGSTGFAGLFGEGVSFVPTGLFGLGAVSRLVNYIKEIDYTKIDIHLVRGKSRDVQIKQYVVQNREVLMTAEGGIKYQEGTDIMQSPLSLQSQLNLRNKGASIFYDMDLLELKKDAFGYWTGPTLKFWGTPAKSESNLGDIITAAGKGMFFGGITRPISGLIGNFRHRLFGDKEDPVEFQK